MNIVVYHCAPIGKRGELECIGTFDVLCSDACYEKYQEVTPIPEGLTFVTIRDESFWDLYPEWGCVICDTPIVPEE